MKSTNAAKRSLTLIPTFFLALIALHLNQPAIGQPSTNGLVGYWSCDSSIIRDQSGYGRNGTLLGAIQPADGWSGTAAQFDGVSGSIDFGSFPSLSDVTVAAYVLIDPEVNILQSNAVSVVNHWRNFALKVRNAGGALKFEGAYSGFGPMRLDTPSVQSLTTPLAGKFYHVAMTYDYHGAARLRLYINGLKENETVTPSSECCDAGIGDPVLYFASQGNTNEFFKGLLDEMRIYNRALSDSEIAGLAVPPSPPKIIQSPPSLLASVL